MTPVTPKTNSLIKPLALGDGEMTVVVKDCIDISEEVTSCGSAAFTGSTPAKRNAAVVDQVLASNCKVVGKANMHELAFGMTGVNEVFGTPINPRWPDRIPGGSSSGSATAVAEGICDFSIGTDTGGSVRQPAICCGLFGIKPTFGRVSRDGCHPASSSLDCVGVFARSAAMLTRGMAAIDPTFKAAKLRQAPRLSRVKCDIEKSLGDELIYGLMEGLPSADYIALPNMQAAFEAGMTLIGKEVAEAFGHLIDEKAPLGGDIAARIDQARNISEAAVQKAEAIRDLFTQEVDAALETFDALITPALPAIPPSLEEAQDPAKVLPLTRFLRPFNLSGHPAIVLPISVGPEKLPSGIQIIGKKGDDAYLCAIAEWMAATIISIHKEESE